MKTRSMLGYFALTIGLGSSALAQETPGEASAAVERILNAVVERESGLAARLAAYHPLVETYLQTIEPDPRIGGVPLRDDYFLGRLESPRKPSPGASAAAGGERRRLFEIFKEFYAYDVKPDGFARMLLLDPESFDREHYIFEFVRREFLGEVRTLVFEVVPKEGAGPGRFIGRIWVEDGEYNVVRYNGIYNTAGGGNLHFDSWRLELRPGLWLPALVYTEESQYGAQRQIRLKFKGQTRIWGYALDRRGSNGEFTKLLIESPLASDRTERGGDVSPVGSSRAWEREAEENVLHRLEKGGLLAPEGEVDAVLETVVSNLEVTNGLSIEPPVRCRVLLTTPLESFTIGHTIVVSRGMIDVLPDEASLAMVLAHELGHILLGHQLDTSYAFSDQMLVGDKQTMERFVFRRLPSEEAEADEKAGELLAKSPYQDKLSNAGLFLKALSERSKTLTALIRPHFGNRLARKNRLLRMTRVLETAPELYPLALNQTPALPLGGRVKVDPWSARIELMRNNRVALLAPREKMPFEVTPLMPYLVRYSDATPAGPPESTATAEAGPGDDTSGETVPPLSP